MRLVDNETRITMNSRRNFVNYATMTLSDGTVLNLKPSDFRVSGNSFTDAWSDGEAFQLGTAIGKTVTLLLDNTDGRAEELGNGVYTEYKHGKFSEYDFYMAYFQLYVCLPKSHHYNGELVDEMISIGTFTVTTPTSRGATIEITGVDNMYMFDKPFNECELDFDTNPSLITILNRCCSDCGVAIGYTTFDNQSLTVSTKPEDVTYRQVVSWIAQIAGCNAVITNTGALTFKWYNMSVFAGGLDGGTFTTTGDTADGGTFNPWNTGYVADGGDFTTLLQYHNLTATNGTSVSTDDIQFTGVSIINDGVSAHYPNTEGWDYYVMQIEDNPFTEGYEATLAQSIYGKLSGLKFRPFSTSSIQDPTIEAGDCVMVYDVKGNMYPSIVTSVTFRTGGMTEIDCTAESPAMQGSRYVNQSAYAVAKAEKKMDTYNSQVAHFNEIASAALGYYKTYEPDPNTGALITYLHDNASLAASTNIVKITASGIFISDDGGQSYNSGYDISTSTMLLNLIYVHGLTSDWIRTGELDVGGLDNADGIITVTNRATITTETIDDSTIYKWLYVGPSQINKSGLYRVLYTISDIETGKDEVITCQIQKRDMWNGSSYSYRVVVDTFNIDAYSGELPIRFEVDTTNGNMYYAIKFSRVATTNAYFTVTTSYNKINTVIDKSGISTSNIQITGGGININNKFIVDNTGKVTATDGEIAGLEIDLLSRGWMYSGTLSGKSYYFEIAAYAGITCGRQPDSGHGANGWMRLDYVTDWGLLKVDYAGHEWGGIVVTNVGNNTRSNNGDYYITVLNQKIRRYTNGAVKYASWSSTDDTSDKRLKDKIRDLTHEDLSTIFNIIEPIVFQFKEETGIDGTHFGVYAQDMENALNKIGVEDSGIVYDAESGYKHLSYHDTIPIQMGAIKDLYQIIDDQQSQINDLKERIKALEDIVNTKE